MTPDQEKKFRDNTNQFAHAYNWAAQTCPKCKKSRSKGHFLNHETCRICRGLK